MNKILKRLVTICMMLLLLISLVSCQLPSLIEGFLGKDTDGDLPQPELDFDKAADNLEAAGYEIMIHNVASSPTGAEKRLDASRNTGGCVSIVELTITVFIDEELAKLYCERIKQTADNSDQETENHIKILEHLKDNYKDAYSEQEYDALIDQIDSWRENTNSEGRTYSFGRKGKIVWQGRSKAIEASLG